MKNKSLKNKITLVLLGRSGCGKGTQAKFIARRLRKEGVRHLETGRFLRSFIKKNNVTAKVGRELMGQGKLFPSWLAAYTWLKELIERGHANKHLVYDGAPRRIWEAELIDEVMRWHGRSLPICIYIDVSPEVATKRLLGRGRKDDTYSKIRNRLKFFSKDVLPTINYYKKMGRLIHVDGRPTPDVIWHLLDRALSSTLGKRWPRGK